MDAPDPDERASRYRLRWIARRAQTEATPKVGRATFDGWHGSMKPEGCIY